MGFSKMATPLSSAYVEDLIGSDNKDALLEAIVESFEQQAHNDDIIIIKGLISAPDHPYAVKVNRAICNAIDARIVLVSAPGNTFNR